MQTAINSSTARLKDELVAIAGAENVRDEWAGLRLHSEDIWRNSDHLVALIVSPVSLDQLTAVVRTANAAGFSIAPRGAGISYTGGYIP